MKIDKKAQRDIAKSFLESAESQKEATEKISQLFERLDQLAEQIVPLLVEEFKNDIQEKNRAMSRPPEEVEYLRNQSEQFGYGEEVTILVEIDEQEYVISCDANEAQFNTLKTLAVKEGIEITHIVGEYDWIDELENGQHQEPQ